MADAPPPPPSVIEVRRTILPYDLTAADNSGAVISHPILKTNNYEEWACGFKTALRSRKKFGFLDGTIPQPLDGSPDLEDWLTINALLVSWMKMTIDSELLTNISHRDVARDLWEQIRKRFSVSNGPKNQKMKADLATCKQEGMTVEGYYGKLNKIWDNINSYRPLRICASHHMTGNLELLSGMRSMSPVLIILADGNKRVAVSEGTVRLGSHLILKSVFYVKELESDLISVGQMMDENHCVVQLADHFLVIQDRTTRMVTGIGKRENGSFCFRGMENAAAVHTSVKAPFDLWHRRLGHASDKIVNLLPRELLSSGKEILENVCDTCMRAKQTRDTFPLRDNRSMDSFQLIHCDVWGPYRTPSYSGARYFLTIVDDYSRGVWVYLMTDKSETQKHLKDFMALVERQFDTEIKTVRSDNGTEFLCMREYFLHKGIAHETSCVGTPHQNGRVERKHRHILNIARALRFQSYLPIQFWGECILSAAYLINRTPSMLLQGKSPYEMLYKTAPKYSHLRVFGSLCYAHNQNHKGDKFAARSRRCVFVGYPHGQKGWRLFDLEEQKFFVSRDVIFQETEFPYSKMSCNRFTSSHKAFLAAVTAGMEPTTYNEAMVDKAWREAMSAEIESLRVNQTFSIVNLPPGKRALGNKWVYKIKYRSDGAIERYKARLVVLGNCQKEGVDYDETFAPVAKMSTVRLFLGVAAARDWHVHQMDVHNAFLHGDLKEEVYMKLPQGFQCDDPSKVCRLHKSLYGLKQAPRCWFSKLSSALKQYGFTQSLSDYSLFSYNNDGVFVHVLVYVDDLIISGSCPDAVAQFKSYLESCFHMKDLGLLKYFLGIEVSRNAQGFYLSQRKYVLDIISEMGLLGARPSAFPLEQNHKLSLSTSPLLSDSSRYRRLVGRLIYLAVTRPELSYSVHTLAQFMQNPRQDHWNAAIRVVRYLKSNPGQGILLSSTSTLQINGWCDSDYAACPLTRRSLTGYFVQLGDTPISWKTKKQPTISRSSAEAEYRAMAFLTQELMWLKRVLYDLGVSHVQAMRIFSDSKSAIALSVNPVQHERTKHVEVDCHFIRDAILDGIIATSFVPSHKQLADILTKALGEKEVRYFLRKLGILDVHAPT
ncbi:LTR retrotransposon like protein [Arabidopsis thaliana]|uniref:LTR retrotransposon like protein n=1 Tax=Arabidopsis thaliana TaxID=3702 RepID=O65452_ARATH|nr:LTR retrotransposon like protein [Arabidopsis thaliana]CAB79159.1 LTR retrotransposon like protein [Arabidopsis thaliana]